MQSSTSSQAKTVRRPAPVRAAKSARRVDFFEGPSARKILSALAHCKAYSTMGLVAGGPGVGKTLAVTHFAGEYPGVHLFTAHPNAVTPYQAMRGLANVLGVARKPGQSGLDLQEDVCKRMRSQERSLIVIDEAQHLKMSALESFRAVHDETRAGLVLMGDLSLHRTVMSQAQLASRVTAPLQLSGPQDADVAELAAAWGVQEPRIVGLLESVARGPGALRITSQVMRLACKSGDATFDEVKKAVQYLGVER